MSDSRTHVVFTDHDPGVLRTIEHNVNLQTRREAKCSTQSLRWGPSGESEVNLIKKMLDDTEKEIDLVLGTDVIYAHGVIALLFWTIDALLAQTEEAVFLMCSSFSYDAVMEQEIDAMCTRYQLKRTILSCELAHQGVRIQQFKRRLRSHQ